MSDYKFLGVEIESGHITVLGIAALLTALTLLINFKTFAFSVATLYTAITIVFSTRTHTIVDFAPVETFGIIIANFYGVHFTVLYLFLSNFFPFLAGGDIAEFQTYVYLGLLTIISFVSTFFIGENYLIGTLIFILVYQFSSFFTSWLLVGFGRAALQVSGETVVQIAYLLTFGRLFLAVLN